MRLFFIACVLALLCQGSAAAQTVPTNFGDQLIFSGIESPTNMAFLPDGRLLVTEQATGRVRVVIENRPTAEVAGTVDSLLIATEAGLIGVAVDPGWPGRPYVYVTATRINPNRVQVFRYTATGDLTFANTGLLTLVPASRYTILSVPNLSARHQGGTLRFGNDQKLYVSIGDDDVLCSAQDLTSPNGKILRLDVMGLPAGAGGPPRYAQITPPDNPFVARADTTARLVFAYGLRNPFGFHIDPLNGCLVIGDVGENTWEEVDRACAPGGQNFGWPLIEGKQRTGIACASPDTTNKIAPIYVYAHGTTLASIIGGPVYRKPPGAINGFDASYEGTIFFGDTWKHMIRNLASDGTLRTNLPGQPDTASWAIGTRWITSLLVGPDGSLWYTLLYRDQPQLGPGEVHKILFYPPTTGGPAARVAMTLGAWPSPTRGGATIGWTLPDGTQPSVCLYDARGRLVRILASLQAGSGSTRWDGLTDDGGAAPAGVYFVKLRALDQERNARLVLVR
jgi:glucose/arabinose dehydrogenase